MTNLQLSELPKLPGIYIIRNFIDDRTYIGSAKNIQLRYQKHIRALKTGKDVNTHLYYFVQKYGVGSIYFDIVELCTIEQLKEREQVYIDTLNPQFNILPQAYSWLGYKHREDTKAKMSASGKGKKQSPEWVAKRIAGTVAGLKGRKQTPEQIAKRVAKNKGQKRPPRSKEWCEKLQKAHKGKVMTEAAKQKLRDYWKNPDNKAKKAEIKNKEEWKAKISAARKGMKCPPRSEEWKKVMSEKTKQQWANGKRAVRIEQINAGWAKKKQQKTKQISLTL